MADPVSSPSLGRPRARYAFASFAALLALGGGYGYRWKTEQDRAASIVNYAVSMTPPSGWKEIPHGPQTIALYRHTDGTLLALARSAVVADENPTPDQDSDALVDHYLQVTKANMPGWAGEKLAPEGDFGLMKRWRDGKTVVSGLCVKGNTTVVVTLSGNGKVGDRIDNHVPTFRRILSDIEFRPDEKMRYASLNP